MDPQATKGLGRRALLAAGAAGVVAVAARAVTAPAEALAADGDPLKIGQTNVGSGETQLVANGSTAFRVGAGGDGNSAIEGSHSDGHTTFGLGGKWISVYAVGLGAGATGIVASADNADGIAVLAGNSANLTVATLGTNTGVWAMAPSNLLALMVEGRTAFSRSGVLTVAKGRSSATKTGLAPLTAKSYVLATLQQYRSGLSIAAAVPNVAAGSITIYLNKAAPSATKVAWFVLESV